MLMRTLLVLFCCCVRVQAAVMVSRYCQSVGDFKGAIEFLLIAKRPDEAFQVGVAM